MEHNQYSLPLLLIMMMVNVDGSSQSTANTFQFIFYLAIFFFSSFFFVYHFVLWTIIPIDYQFSVVFVYIPCVCDPSVWMVGYWLPYGLYYDSTIRLGFEFDDKMTMVEWWDSSFFHMIRLFPFFFRSHFIWFFCFCCCCSALKIISVTLKWNFNRIDSGFSSFICSVSIFVHKYFAITIWSEEKRKMKEKNIERYTQYGQRQLLNLFLLKWSKKNSMNSMLTS